jgi:hypothetical protein
MEIVHFTLQSKGNGGIVMVSIKRTTYEDTKQC